MSSFDKYTNINKKMSVSFVPLEIVREIEEKKTYGRFK